MTDYYAAAERHYAEGDGAFSRNDFRKAQARATLALAAIELAKATAARTDTSTKGIQIPVTSTEEIWFSPERGSWSATSAPVRPEADEEVVNIFLVVDEQDGHGVKSNIGEPLTLVPLDRAYDAVRGRKVRYVGSSWVAFNHPDWPSAHAVVVRAARRTKATD